MAVAGVLSHGHPLGSPPTSDYELLTQATGAMRPLADVIPGDQRPSASSNPLDPMAEPLQWVTECLAPVDPSSVETTTVRVADFTGDGGSDIHWLGDEYGHALYLLDSDGWTLRRISHHSLMYRETADTAQPGNFVGPRESPRELVWVSGSKVHVSEFSPASGGAWVEAAIPAVDIAIYDPFWDGSLAERCGPGGGDFHCGDAKFDPLLRVGDLDGDGLDDVLVVGQHNLVFLRNIGGTRFEPLAINNAPFVRPAFSETMALGNVAPAPGDELILRGDCGLEIYSLGDTTLELLWQQPCASEEFSFNASNGFLEFDRWIIAVGQVGGAGDCDDIVIRGRSQLLALESSCSSVLTFDSLPLAGAQWHQPFHLFGGWGDRVTTPIIMFDINRDGIDDVASYTTHGLRARLNSGIVGTPWLSLGRFALVGGRDQIDWSPDLAHLGDEQGTINSLYAGSLFGGVNRQLVGLDQLGGCWSATHLP